MAIFFVFIGVIGYFLAYQYNSPELFYFAVILSIIMNAVSYWYSDKIALSLSGAKEANRSQNFDLFTIVENLSITSGLPMPKIYIIEDSAPNAFATGRDKYHSSIAVTSGLLERLNKQELEGVLAHEISHIGNRDILLMSIVVVLVGLISIIADFFLRSNLVSRKNSDREGGGFLTIVGILLIILSPIIATIIKLAISRRREYLADASAALLTRYPEGLASALEKIASYSSPMKNVHAATAHMFISSPFFGTTKSFSNLFSTHPPIVERIRILKNMSL